MFDAEDLLGNDPRREFERVLVMRCRAGDAFALMLVELDGLSRVCEQFGIHVGNLVLYEVMARLRGKLREHDLVIRSGSNEIAVFVRGVERVHGAEQLAHELIERVQQPIMVAGARFRLNVSIGISLSPRQSGEWRLLLQDADAAVHDAKVQGRGHVSIGPA